MRAETAGFEKASHEYERGRPGYPPETVEWIVETAGLGEGTTVVDLAAGTGKLTRELVGTRAAVIAVEPLDAMRARLVDSLPGVSAVKGSAEATGLEDGVADAVTIAQAFHWFAGDEALAEVERVLREEGLLFLVWNRRDLSDPTQVAISRLTAPHIGDAPAYGSGQWRQVMEASTRFVPVAEHRARHLQIVDRTGIVDRVASTSYIANLAEEVRLPLLENIASLVPEGETAGLSYVTDAYAYHRA